MPDQPLSCTKCHLPLPGENLAELTACPHCRNQLTVAVFPAWSRLPEAGRASVAGGVDEASCFYHAASRATVACDACGRFLCALCDVELDGRHLCPGCLRQGRSKGKITSLENERILYEDIALALAIYPVLFLWLTLLTAPAAIVMAVYSWRRPGSLMRRMRWRAVVAIVLGGLQIAGWAAILVMVFTGAW